MITVNVRRCGRLDDHTPHEWWGRQHPQPLLDPYQQSERLQFWCVGSVAIEGGGRTPVLCENCGHTL